MVKIVEKILITLVVLGLALGSLVGCGGSLPENGYDSSWGYRKQITIVGTTDGAQTNYQMKLTVHYNSGSSWADDVYLDSHSQGDFDDIRFTRDDGVTPMPYWVEETTNYNNTVVWVKFSSVPVSPSSGVFYIYYGNSSATSASNGPSTWNYYEDMETDINNFTDFWETGMISRATDQVKHGSYSLKIVDVSATELGGFKYWIEGVEKARFLWWQRMAQNNQTFPNSVQDTREGPSYDGPHWRLNDRGQVEYCPDGINFYNVMAYSANTWYRMENEVDTSIQKYNLWVDNVLRVDNKNYTSALNNVGKLRIASTRPTTPTVWIDTLCVGAYANPEPIWGVWGNEESDE